VTTGSTRRRAALEEARSEAVRDGSAFYDYGLLWNRSIAELAAGNVRLARELADEALMIAEQMDEPSLVSFALMLALFPAVVLGEVDAARRSGEQALELARRMRDQLPRNGVLTALGLLELSLGRVDAAAALYRQLTFGLSRHSNVAGGRGLLDVIEAFAEAGEVERAAELAARLPDEAHEKPLAEACVAAARGELERAIELVHSIEPSPAPFRRARERLLLGRLLRRARKKREARAELEAAKAGFLTVEAPLWVERTAEELARLGGRSPASASAIVSRVGSPSARKPSASARARASGGFAARIASAFARSRQSSSQRSSATLSC
jgi:tetratricopeptide (TPR) repeat protein